MPEAPNDGGPAFPNRAVKMHGSSEHREPPIDLILGVFWILYYIILIGGVIAIGLWWH